MRPRICVTDAYRLLAGLTCESDCEVKMHPGEWSADMLEADRVEAIGMLESDSLIDWAFHYSATSSSSLAACTAHDEQLSGFDYSFHKRVSNSWSIHFAQAGIWTFRSTVLTGRSQ